MKKNEETILKKGRIIFFNGLSGSGKTTLAQKLVSWLRKKNKPVFLIDGDVTRDFFEDNLGFTHSERLRSGKRNAFGAKLLSENGINVILAAMISNNELRDFHEKKLEFFEIFLDADIKDCMKNDPKGIYAEAIKRENPQISGYDLEFYNPKNPALTLYPYKETPDRSFQKICDFIIEMKIF